MTVRYTTSVTVESHGVTYQAQSLTGSQAAEILRRAEAIEGRGADDPDVERTGLAMAAHVTACCLLGDDGRPSFGQGKDQLVLEECPLHLILAVFRACMADAGLSDDEEAEDPGN